MHYFHIYLHYLGKMAIMTKIMFTKPAGIISMVPSIFVTFLTPAFSVSQRTPTQMVLILLFGLFLLDFATGIYASWIEKKQKEKEDPELAKENLISSKKLRLSGVKAFIYCSGTLAVYGVEKVFFIKTFKFESVSEQGFTITMLIVAFFCAIEFYSIFFENFKRAGFDIVAMVKKIKGTKTELTE